VENGFMPGRIVSSQRQRRNIQDKNSSNFSQMGFIWAGMMRIATLIRRSFDRAGPVYPVRPRSERPHLVSLFGPGAGPKTGFTARMVGTERFDKSALPLRDKNRLSVIAAEGGGAQRQP